MNKYICDEKSIYAQLHHAPVKSKDSTVKFMKILEIFPC